MRTSEEKANEVLAMAGDGTIRQVTVEAFRCDCPFCGRAQSMTITLGGSTKKSYYGCSECHAYGETESLKKNVDGIMSTFNPDGAKVLR